MSETKKYKVISPLHLGEERYDIGAPVVLTDAVAKDLLGHTVVPDDQVLGERQLAQGASVIAERAEELSQWQLQLQADRIELEEAVAAVTKRESAVADGEAVLVADRHALDAAKAALVADQAALAAGRADLANAQAKLDADRSAFEKAAKAKK